jgi:hypothetical protein
MLRGTIRQRKTRPRRGRPGRRPTRINHEARRRREIIWVFNDANRYATFRFNPLSHYAVVAPKQQRVGAIAQLIKKFGERPPAFGVGPVAGDFDGGLEYERPERQPRVGNP